MTETANEVPEIGGADQPETPTVDDDPDVEDTSDEDPNEAVVDLTEDDLETGGDLFSGVEDASGGESVGDDESDEDAAQSDSSDSEGDSEGDGIADGLEGNAAHLEDSINEGMARMAMIGLTDDDLEDSKFTKDGLEEEFADTFAAFRLGYFGSAFVDEYILSPQDGDVDPTWGLLGSMLMATAMVVWMRPDGDQAVSKARETIGNLAGGAL